MRRAKMCPPPQFFLTGTPMSVRFVTIELKPERTEWVLLKLSQQYKDNEVTKQNEISKVTWGKSRTLTCLCSYKRQRNFKNFNDINKHDVEIDSGLKKTEIQYNSQGSQELCL